MDAVLERFIAHSPMAVAVRGAFEYALSPPPLDDLFVRTVGHRDDRELPFSTCVDLMATVVCRVKPSVHAAYQAQDHISVNVTAVYARLARVPATAGRELVRHTADRLGPVIRAMGGAVPDPLPGYRVKVLDGNHLGKTQRRIKPLRDVVAGPLPGQALVLDPALGLAIDVVPCEDGRLRAVPARSHLGDRGRERRVGRGPELLHHRLFVRDRRAERVLRDPAAHHDSALGAGVGVGRSRSDRHRDAGRADHLADGTRWCGVGSPACAAHVGPPDPGR